MLHEHVDLFATCVTIFENKNAPSLLPFPKSKIIVKDLVLNVKVKVLIRFEFFKNGIMKKTELQKDSGT